MGRGVLRVLLLPSWSFHDYLFVLIQIIPNCACNISPSFFERFISWCFRKYNILGSSCIFPVPGWSQSSLQGVLVHFNVKWHSEAMIWALGLLITIKVSLLQSQLFQWTDLEYMRVLYSHTHTHFHLHFYFYLPTYVYTYVYKCVCERETQRERNAE